MNAEFEEKQYESLLNKELMGNFPLYPAGQCFENKIGIDDAIYSRNRAFWNLWRNLAPFIRSIPQGVLLDHNLWNLIEEDLLDNQFPKFRFNIFIQYKRPQYISSVRGKEYRYWKQPYYRYDITSHQQDILCELQDKISFSAIVVYACSAFWRFTELWAYSETNQLINNSNFVQPRDLKNHERYTFINSGNKGMAFSEPIDIENIDLTKLIESKFETQKFENNIEFIYSLNNSIMEVLDTFNDYKRVFNSLLRDIKVPNHILAKKITNISLFTFITNTNWYIGFENGF